MKRAKNRIQQMKNIQIMINNDLSPTKDILTDLNCFIVMVAKKVVSKAVDSIYFHFIFYFSIFFLELRGLE